MPTPLPKYKSIKDIYCIGYYGFNKKIILDLNNYKFKIEEVFPGIKIALSFNKEEILVKIKNKEFAYFRELIGENDDLVKNFLKESKIDV